MFLAPDVFVWDLVSLLGYLICIISRHRCKWLYLWGHLERTRSTLADSPNRHAGEQATAAAQRGDSNHKTNQLPELHFF